MESNDVVQRILNIPHLFNNSMDVTIIELLKETGYLQIHYKIFADNIRKALKEHQQFITEWISYSENKRTNSGYYLKKEENDYIVGYLNEGRINCTQRKYSNIIDACAEFIKLEIEEIRLLYQKRMDKLKK